MNRERSSEAEIFANNDETYPTMEDYSQALRTVKDNGAPEKKAQSDRELGAKATKTRTERTSGIDGSMNNAEAQQEANMTRVIIRQNEKSEFTKGDRQPTKEDYEKALAIVDEMKKLAAGESLNKKLLYKLLRAYEQITFWPNAIMGTDSLYDHDQAMRKLADEEYKLRQLIKKSDRLGQTMSDNEKQNKSQ